MSPAKEVTRSGMELYTKKGDGGRASTITRMNIPKNSPIFELLGTLDEFTSALGVAKRKAPPPWPLCWRRSRAMSSP